MVKVEKKKAGVAERLCARAEDAARAAVPRGGEGAGVAGGVAGGVGAWGDGVPQGGDGDLSLSKTIIHPGEVNRIRAWAKDASMVVTHSDSPKPFFWNVQRQPDRAAEQRGGDEFALVPL